MTLDLDLTDAHLLLAALATRLRVLGDLDPKRLNRRVRQTEEGERIRALVARVEEQLYAVSVEGKVADLTTKGSGL